MDFLSIRKKARERAGAKEAATSAPEERAPAAAGTLPGAEPAPEGATVTPASAASPLEEPAEWLAPASDGRFATWRPGSGPPPVEPDPMTYAAQPASSALTDESRALLAAAIEDLPAAPEEGAAGRLSASLAATLPVDPLDAFFYRPDEEAAIVPMLGGSVTEEPLPGRSEQLDELLTFRIGEEEFAVPIRSVREVLRSPNITEVPRAPTDVLGVVTVRGEVVPVLDARARLGVAGGEGGATGGRIVIVDADDGALGVLVDAVVGVVRLPRGAIEPCPQGISTAASDCVTGIGRWRDRLFTIVDVGALLRRGRPAEHA